MFKRPLGLAAAVVLLLPAGAVAAQPSFIGSLHKVSTVGSTVPVNGDQNPTGSSTSPPAPARWWRATS